MSVIASPIPGAVGQPMAELPQRSSWSFVWRSGRVMVGGSALAIILILCLATLPWTLSDKSSLYYAGQTGEARGAPRAKIHDELNPSGWLGYDALGRSLLG